MTERQAKPSGRITPRATPPNPRPAGFTAAASPDRIVVKEQARLSDLKGGATVFVLVDGVVMLEMLLGDGRRQVYGFRYPGDLVNLAFNRLLPAGSATALTDVTLAPLGPDDAGDVWPNKTADRTALAGVPGDRHVLHILALGRLLPQERVASLLLEVALRCGKGMGERVYVTLPMSRGDIADYLCLHADTVSRVFSRFRQMGVLGPSTSGETYVSKMQDLCALTPLAPAILDRHGSDGENHWSSGLARQLDPAHDAPDCAIF